MKKMTLRKRLILAFLCIFCIPVIVLGVPGTYIIGQRSRQTAEVRMQGEFEQLFNSFERIFDDMDSFANEMQKAKLIYALTYMQNPEQEHTRFSAIDYNDFAYQIKMSLVNNDSFDDLALLFPSINFGLSQRGEYQMDKVLENEFRVNDISLDEWQGLMRRYLGGNMLLLDCSVSTFDINRNGMLYMKCMQPAFGTDPRLVFLFFTSESKLKARFMNYGLDENVDLYFELGENRQHLIRVHNEPEGRLYEITRDMPNIGGRLVMTIPESELYHDAASMQILLILVLSLILLFGSVVTVIAATINYRPLEGFFSTLFSNGTIGAVNPTSDDLQSVSQMLSNLETESRKVKEDVVLYRGLLRYAAISRLMDGTLDRDSIGTTFRALDMEFTEGWFTVCILMSLSWDAVRAFTDICYASKITCYSIDFERYQVFLLNHADPLDVMKLDYNSDIYIAVSDPFDDLRDAAKAYHQAKSIMDYRPLYNQSHLLISQNCASNDVFYFPLDEERQLNNLIKAGDINGAVKKCESLIEENLREQPSYAGINRFFDMLEMCVNRMIGDSRLTSMQRESYSSVEERRQRIIERLNSIEKNNKPDKSEANEEFNRILDYMDEHLCDPQLSLAVIADSVNMNPSALSKLIKRNLGMGYLEYINQKRIALAKVYLRSGKISIRELAQSVGFDNDATLRRLFKKYEGITPTQYHE